LLEIGGANSPAGYTLDGASYAALLTSSSKTERKPIYWHFPGYLGAGQQSWRTTPVSVVRSGDWKLLEFLEDKRVELYNLRQDVGEQHNLAPGMTDKANELLAALNAWRIGIGAPMPTRNNKNSEASGAN
jgi:arylsulfatase A-like enzyme